MTKRGMLTVTKNMFYPLSTYTYSKPMNFINPDCNDGAPNLA